MDEEHSWEPHVDYDPRAPSPELIFPEGHFEERLHLPQSRVAATSTSTCLREPFVVHYPDPRAGAPIQQTQDEILDENHQYAHKLSGASAKPWAPFENKTDWKMAHWAKVSGLSSTALSELLAIDGVQEKLGLSYRNANELNSIIDDCLPPARPQFQRQEVVVQGQVLEMYYRDILACVKALYGDAEFAEYLKFTPERHYTDSSCNDQLYHDMHTGDWWWSAQANVDKHVGTGRTIVPIILSSDKTQVTLFRNKSVYPVYMTISNIPKEIRRKPSCRAYVLIGYLPTTGLEHIKNETSRRRSIVNMFHTCMRIITQPLEEAGVNGLVLSSGDGIQRHGHPLYAAYIGDYPEQILVTCCITGECPRCMIPRQRIGENTEPHPLRNIRSILNILSMPDRGAVFVEACKLARIKQVFEPFWAKLPFSNVFLSITPDILHQLYQGVFKHLKNWVIQAYGAHEIDARCRRLPPNHNMRLFMKGITSLQRISGEEHAQISHFLLGLIAEASLPDGMSSACLLRCLRGLMDFLFLAQYPVHSTTTLQLLSEALSRFHDNKRIFIDLDIRSDFHIPKIHFMNHYVESVKHMGTFDNFNTEYTERLHIDLAKDAYRATNKKDELSQMTKWLERKEKISKHATFLEWAQSGKHPPLRMHWVPPGLNPIRTLKMTKNPSIHTVKISDIIQTYGATFFKAALARFVVQLKQPELSGLRLDNAAEGFFLGVSHISAYHRVKYTHKDFFTDQISTVDSIHVQPTHMGKYEQSIPGRFDTALVHISDPSVEGPLNIIQDTRVAQVRLVFTLPENIADDLFGDVPEHDRPEYLAYIEWFTPFMAIPDANHGLYKVARCNVEGGCLASIVDIRRLICSVHLIPRFGPVANREWSSSTVLEDCKSFFVNMYSDRYIYQLFSS
ncbi:hypothetical protein DFJ43DRAFT_1008331 [Lentinula guzmanii]|uniref:Uncharacterized protein n=1 Tax=Lentinula guzmanii TaxID=2804957 RepID=A0AA38MQN6_9AGAR|nr:hypothetical protein DFJ43DRAFT_1008331 [Lentinula guzmanii]